MGYSSYLCKHCNHGILSEDATAPHINEWMAAAVLLAPNGSRLFVAEYSGFSGDYEDFEMNGSVWVHQACWENAGRPEFSGYDGPSRDDPNQGAGGPDTFIIDPRITDEAERARLLAEGMNRRHEGLLNEKARLVADWMDPDTQELYRKTRGGEVWRLRYGYHETYPHNEDGTDVLDTEKDGTHWRIIDHLDVDRETPYTQTLFRGTEVELKAHLAASWARFVESEECRTLLDRQRALRDAARAELIEDLKDGGRYQVIATFDTKGDTVVDVERTRQGQRLVYAVSDGLTNRTVATMGAPVAALGIKSFQAGSPEWEARWEALQAASDESRRLAQAAADRLNMEWREAGFPAPKEWA